MTAITGPMLRGLATSMCEYARRRPVSFTQYADAPAPAENTVPDEESVELPTHWAGCIGVEGELTGDGRLIESGALEWETPIPLRYVMEDNGGHDGAVTIGRILSIERGDDGKLNAFGDFDLGSEVGREAARVVAREVMNGVSMDLDSVAYEARVAAEVLEAQRDLMDAMGSDEDFEEPAVETDDDGRVVVWKGGPDDEVFVTMSGRVRAATLVSIPAFIGAKLYRADPPAAAEQESLVASAAPVEPPQVWFFREEPDAPTALTITDDGQVYGHLATWDTCHIGDPAGAGECVMAPKNASGYAFFHTGAVKTAEGTQVPTGTIRFRTGHADLRARADSAQAHYDNTGTAGADIHVTDGKHGIWVSGALRPGISDEQIRELRAAPLSGDWRYIKGSLELVGALAVNLPGFPVPRVQGMVASGTHTALVAAGMLPPRHVAHKQFSDRDAQYLRRLAERERTREQREIVDRVKLARNKAKLASILANQRISEARQKVGA